MARIHPREPDADTPTSERKVFEKLRDLLPDAWEVFHSRRRIRLRSGARPEEVELDFLVLDPARGFLGLEVKGGAVSRDGDGWRTRDRRGREDSIKDPGRQAQNATHALARYLHESPALRRGGIRLRYGFGVVFPDVDVRGDLGPDLPRSLVLDRADLDYAYEALDRMMEVQGLDGPPLAPSGLGAVREALCPVVRLVPSLAARVEHEAPLLLRLTEEQEGILDALHEFRRAAIRGEAGSGKTVLAMEKARRLATEGRRVLLLCFNRPLADHLGSRANAFSVSTFHALCREGAAEAGLPFEIPEEPAERSEFWARRAPEILLEALGRASRPLWDAVVVDEGQDFLENWWVPIESLLAPRGPGVLWVFFDPHQNLYGGGPPAALGVEAAHLRWNCRNTARIAAHAAGILGLEPRLHPRAPEGEPVEVVECPDDAALARGVRNSLHRLLTEGRLTPDRVVVLSPHSPVKCPVFRGRTYGNYSLVMFPNPLGPNEVHFSSLHRYKGLEADAVILCDTDGGTPACTPTHLYVAASRARHLLVVLRRTDRDGGGDGSP